MDKRAALLSIKPRTESVDVPGVGTVIVRGLKADEVIELAKAQASGSDIPMLVYCILNDDGSPMFTQADLPQLLALPMETLMPLLNAAKRLAGLNEAEKKASASAS